MQLSVCMIVKNEEKNIERAIKSALPVADEIVIVDTGSTDNTVEIARNLVGRVYFSPWIDDFADARNKSIAVASKDLIMWLDADDVIPESTYAAINDIKHNGDRNAFYSGTINCTEVSDVDYVIKPIFTQSRIFPNNRGILFENKIHESFTKSAINNGCYHVNRPDLIIEHRGYQSREELERKRRRNIRIIMSCLGFPENTDYYEFDHKECFCVYTPNVVVAWRGIEYIGAFDVENSADMEASVRKAVDKIIDNHEMKQLMAEMERMRNEVLNNI